MRKIKFSTLLLSVLFVLSVFFSAPITFINANAENSYQGEQITYIDFEGDQNYNFTYAKDGSYEQKYVTESSGNNFYYSRADSIWNSDGSPWAIGGYRLLAGIKEGWLDNTRPLSVSFKLNLAHKDLNGNQELVYFDPIWRWDATNYFYGRLSFLLDYSKNTLSVSQSIGENSGNALACTVKNATPLSLPAVQNLSDGNWITVAVDYDWSLFNEAGGWTVSLDIKMSKGNEVASADVSFKLRDATNSNYTANSATVVSETKGYSLGFSTRNLNTTKINTGIDDISITEWYTAESDETDTETSTSSAQKVLFDFEGSSPYALTHWTGKNCNEYKTIGGNTYLQTSYNQYNIPLFATQNGPYGNGRAAAGISEGWLENTRPTQVSFKLNLGYIKDMASSLDIAGFDPLWRVDATNYNFFRIGFYITVNSEDRTKDTLTLHTFGGNNASVFIVNGEITSEALTVSPVSSLDIANDITVKVKYDWSKFTFENGYAVTLEITLTDGNGNSALSTVPLKYRDPTNKDVPAEAAGPVTEKKGYSIGFTTGNSTKSKLAIGFDDIKVWGYNAANPSEKYGAKGSAEQTALGATAANYQEDDIVKVKMGFNFRGVELEEGESVKEYGGIVVAGTKKLSVVKENLEAMLKQNLTSYNGYSRTKRTVDSNNPLPEEYYLVINNSGDAENLGKRTTALSYIVVYNEFTDTEELFVTNEVINKSTTGLLKSIFKAKYLLPEYTKSIATVVAAYNSDLTMEDLFTVSYKSTTTTSEEKVLLKDLHFAINNTINS